MRLIEFAPLALLTLMAGCGGHKSSGSTGNATAQSHQDIAMEDKIHLGPDESNSLIHAIKPENASKPTQPLRAIVENNKVSFKALEANEASKPPANERELSFQVTSADGSSRPVKVWASAAAEQALRERKTNPP